MTKGRDLDDKDLAKVTGGMDINEKSVDDKPSAPPADAPSTPPFNAPTGN